MCAAMLLPVEELVLAVEEFNEEAPAPPSALSQYFPQFRNAADPEAREASALAGLVDTALRSMHEASQRNKPSVQALLISLPQQDRLKNVTWLLQAFRSVRLSDATLYKSAQLLDRYYAKLNRRPDQVSANESQLMMLASVCVALKVGDRDDINAQFRLREVVENLTWGQVQLADVLRAEVLMLRVLMFNAGTPTALDHLDAHGTKAAAHRARDLSLARFLLQLTLGEAFLHYRYPHAILATGALALAMHTLNAPAAAYGDLLTDLAVQLPGEEDVHEQVLDCCADIHQLWVQSVSWSEFPLYRYAKILTAKFSRPEHHGVSGLEPPREPPTSMPPQPLPGVAAMGGA